MYDLKYYYLFLYNLYVENKVILPLFFLNDKNEADIVVLDKNASQVKHVKELIYFNSLFNRYNIEIFNNNVHLTYNTFIYNLKNNKILIDNILEKKIKRQVIHHNLIKKYLKCNKITYLILTELL